jgi:mono/diheme cytochrome c family protein
LLLTLLAPTLASAESGLLARYTDGKQTIQTVAVSPAFALKDNESVHPQIGPKFTAEYEGTLNVLRRATYTFDTPGATLSIDGKPVTGPMALEPGEHAIAIRYQRPASGAARFQPTWSSDQFLPEPIPASVFTHTSPTAAAKRQALVERGRLLAEEHNCAACHKGGGQHLASRVGPDLTNVGARATAEWMFKWLENPRHFRAGAVMPATLATADDRRDVAAYLSTLKDPKKKVNEYKPSESKSKQGAELYASIGCANCHQESLALDNEQGGQGSKWTSIGQLAAYLKDPLSIDRSGRMPSLMLSDEESVALANHLLRSKRPEYEAKLPDGADAKRGEQIFRTAGCLNCHKVEGDAGKPLPDAKTFAALDKLDPAKGCLAEAPPASAPRYHFSAEDRQAAAAFVASVKAAPLVSSAPADQWHRSLRKFNCVACHETEQSKPPEGQEIVPPLNNVGAKLRRDWMSQVLSDRKARVRFWLKARMPDFGSEVHKLADHAVAAAGAESLPESQPTPTTAQIKAGQQLVGNNDPAKNPAGMGCVTCHSLREFKPAVAADATRGPELTLMTPRLRPDFFRRWMHEPARIQPGTAMPNFFTDKPRDQADQAIETLWAYASLGVGMPAPLGVKEKKNYVLIVTDTPLVARAQVPDPGGTIVYGISVGLPGLVNYTFDAQRATLRAAWLGGFLDMTGDWDGRGGNPVKVLGKRFYSPQTNPLRLGSPDDSTPAVFKGYDLKDRIPTFLYSIGDVEVRERITATGEGRTATLIRTFELDPAGKPVFVAVADEPTVTISPSQGQFKPAEVLKSYKSPEKTAGQILELPGTGKLTFSLTIKPKDAK